MKHDTPSTTYEITYQIALTYLERHKGYALRMFSQLFDIGVKDQGQINVMMVLLLLYQIV